MPGTIERQKKYKAILLLVFVKFLNQKKYYKLFAYFYLDF